MKGNILLKQHFTIHSTKIQKQYYQHLFDKRQTKGTAQKDGKKVQRQAIVQPTLSSILFIFIPNQINDFSHQNRLYFFLLIFQSKVFINKITVA